MTDRVGAELKVHDIVEVYYAGNSVKILARVRSIKRVRNKPRYKLTWWDGQPSTYCYGSGEIKKMEPEDLI